MGLNINEETNTHIAQDIYKRSKLMEASGVNVINFALGTLGFEIPQFVHDSAVEALRIGRVSVQSESVLAELRTEICDYIDRTRGFRPKLDQILIGPGGKSMLFCVLLTILKRGSEIITTDPAKPYYGRFTKLLNGKMKYIPLICEDNNYKLDFSAIEGAFSKKTKIVILNTPHDPTGELWNNTTLQELSDLTANNNSIILSDETFSQIIFDGHHISPSIMDRAQEHTIILEDLSYSLSLPGWQISFCIGPNELIEQIRSMMVDLLPRVQDFLIFAAVDALKKAEKLVYDNVNKFRKCGENLITGLNELSGFSCNMPSGSVHAFPDISGTGVNGIELSEILLEKAGIAVLPGEVFGNSGKNHLRFSFATTIDQINEGLTRMQELF